MSVVPPASALRSPSGAPNAEPESYRALFPPLWSVAVCAIVLVAIKLVLALVGFSRSLRWVESVSRAPLAQPPAGVKRVEQAERTVALAAALYPGRALCLEQSLTLHAILRRGGVASQLRLGAQRHPFAAHAWVEVGGVPVNDVVEHVRHFTPFPDVPV